MAARKRKKSTSSNYAISLDEDDTARGSDQFFGKLRANFIGTEFVIYDKGAKPKEATAACPARTEQGIVMYEYNGETEDERASGREGILRAFLRRTGRRDPAMPPAHVPPHSSYCLPLSVLGTRGPRKMTTVIPSVDDRGQRAKWQPLRDEDSMLAKFKATDMRSMTMLKNKTPKWNDQMQAYVLNFNGRVTHASVKNFQLVTEGSETVVLQFGKVGSDSFTMDFTYPMSALQAFAICLSSFDHKLACE